MSEKIKPPLSIEQQRIIKESVTITRPKDLVDPGRILDLCEQVSDQINLYVSSHPDEMLKKTPETIYKQIEKGLSVMLVHQNGGHPKMISHATAYEALTEAQSEKLGCQIFEAGSVITHPDFQNQGLGKRVSSRLAYVIEDRCQNPIWLATNKQSRAFLAMTHGADMRGGDFFQFPYLTSLTCTCHNCSENFGHQCNYRRPSHLATPQIFNSIKVDPKNGQMPCTLIVSDTEKARIFEDTCRKLSTTAGIPPVMPGEISIDIMSQIRNFYNYLND